MPVVEEQARTTSEERIHEQIEITVAIYIREDRPRGFLSNECHTRFDRYVLKFQISKISVKTIGSSERTEIDIASAISVNVTERDARAIFQSSILLQESARDGVTEIDAGDRR